MITEQQIIDILQQIEDPKSQKKLSEISKIEGVSDSNGLLKIRLHIQDLQPTEKTELRSLLEESFSNKGFEALISITTSSSVQPKPSSNPNIKPFLSDDILKRFKKIIAVYSTKGGVGKSTVAANLVIDLAKKGLKTAIIDLDIYGPSIPRILGMKGKVSTYENKFVPAEIDGIHMMSVGLLLPNIDSPLIWRAPIVNGVISQIFTDTLWDEEYDILVLDLPPGTGDIPILVGQSIPLDGMIVVSTPQGVALEDTIKGVSMFQKFNVPIIGFVYNMGSVICKECDKLIPIFKNSTEFDELLMNYNINIVANLPLDPEVTEYADKGDLLSIEESGVWKTEFSKITNIIITELNLNI